MYMAKKAVQRKRSTFSLSLLKVMLLVLTINRKILGKRKASFRSFLICTARDMILLF